jgi:penicillin-binding protein 1A
MDPQDGAIVSLVGGFDFYTNAFNRAYQARRQPGSGFKPFFYSAALEHGFTPASIILDAPIVEDGPDIEGAWRPQNSSKTFHGPVPLREGLFRSLNMVSIRIIRDIGVDAAIEHAAHFGFDPDALPHNQTLALGTLVTSPLQMATAYSTFANGGYKVENYFIDRIENAAGETLFRAAPKVVCNTCDADAAATPPSSPDAAPAAVPTGLGSGPSVPPALALSPPPGEAEAEARREAEIAKRNAGTPPSLAPLAALQGGRGYLPADRIAPRVVSAANVWVMTDIMSDVIRRGTAVRARVLNRTDIAGKTGTSNLDRDAWFNGFTPHLVATTWVGYDEERSLGEESSSVGVPVWIHFMREALRSVPEDVRPMPPGVVRLRVSPKSGTLADANDPDAVSEVFLADHLPEAGAPGSSSGRTPSVGGPTDPLF